MSGHLEISVPRGGDPHNVATDPSDHYYTCAMAIAVPESPPPAQSTVSVDLVARVYNDYSSIPKADSPPDTFTDHAAVGIAVGTGSNEYIFDPVYGDYTGNVGDVHFMAVWAIWDSSPSNNSRQVEPFEFRTGTPDCGEVIINDHDQIKKGRGQRKTSKKSTASKRQRLKKQTRGRGKK